MAKYTVKPKELIQTEVKPVETRMIANGALFVDFGKAAFGTLLVPLPKEPNRKSIVVHLGEKLSGDGRIDENLREQFATFASNRNSTDTRIPAVSLFRLTNEIQARQPLKCHLILVKYFLSAMQRLRMHPASTQQISAKYPCTIHLTRRLLSSSPLTPY